MTKFKIALDDGHGMETAGKRTPIFPEGSGMKSETGNFMHENEFNRAVVKKLDKKFKSIGIDTVLLAPGDRDIPLKDRVKTANDNNVDLVVSVHANAHKSVWGTAEGIETYHSPTSVKGKELATLVQKELVKGTPQRNRGVKSANFYILIRTNAPAILVEAGFMDNLREAKLLLSDNYREETAQEIFVGVCKYLNVQIDKQEEDKPSIPHQEIFRVRKSWEDVKSQNGAYSNLENAKERVALLGEEYKVYDSKGKQVYPEMTKEHWAEKHFKSLNDKGITVSERRFDDTITRGEMMALLDKATDGRSL